MNPYVRQLFGTSTYDGSSAEIDEHPRRVERVRFKDDDCPAVVSVEVPTLAIIIEQAMTVTKLDFACYSEHVDVN